jgi:alpha-beta hydrolase superfamily lysophospholipase
MDQFRFTSRDGTEIACYRWRATAEPRGILQISHGMGEHALRYAPVAEFYANAGFHVVASDHRGHGRSVKRKEGLGDFGAGGWNALIADMVTLTRKARAESPDLKLILLGHSMGSFALQQYLLDYSGQIGGAVLSGSAAADRLGLDPEREVDLSAINAPFEPARTPFDWLSRDAKEVDKYVADPLCGFGVSKAGTQSMATAMARTVEPRALALIRKDLPIYIFAGDRDPVNAGLDALKIVAQRYRAAGLSDVTEKYYPGGRHEMFNETNRAEVMRDLLGWMNRVVGE